MNMDEILKSQDEFFEIDLLHVISIRNDHGVNLKMSYFKHEIEQLCKRGKFEKV